MAYKASTGDSEMSVAEMRMLRWMCGKSRIDRIRNETIRETVSVASIWDKLRKNRLRWFRHVYDTLVAAIVKKSYIIVVDGWTKGKGRLKLTLEVMIRKDLHVINLNEEVALDRAPWKNMIHVVDLC